MVHEYLRVRPGVPEGGRFTEAHRGSVDVADIDLGPVPGHVEPSKGQWQARLDRLAGQGFVPPAALDATARDTRSAAGAVDDDVRTDWWERQAATAERRHRDGDYPQMPDDNTPNRHLGQSASGHRRTHRMNYQGAGVSLRMPSATAIRRFAAASPRKTFDVPVTAEHPGGSVQGWVRVTRGADGEWDARGLNFTGSDEAYVAEAVRCVMEGQRPRHALAEAGDLIARRRERDLAVGTTLSPVDSSWVKAVGYDAASATTVITTKQGSIAYGWSTSPATFAALYASRSPGVVVNNIKKAAPGVAIDTCPRCTRSYRSGLEHHCPPRPAPRAGGRIEANDITLGAGARAAFRRTF